MALKNIFIWLIIPVTLILLVGCSYQKNRDMLHSVVGENEFVIVEVEYNSSYASMETFEINCSIKNKTKNSFYINHGANFFKIFDDEYTEAIAIGKKEYILVNGILTKTIEVQTSDVVDNKITIIVEFDIVSENTVHSSVHFTKDIIFD